ncbi:MAG: hypothetical protein IT331_06255 [Anaerolineae bacterium]|nr:hypothetical protein [Anaerolineae bacterium]
MGTWTTQRQAWVSKHWIALLFIGLALVLGILYAPTFGMGFVTDDFIEVGARHFDARDGLYNGDNTIWFERFIERALIDPVSGQEIFRPTRQTIFWADYFVWRLEPFGYHLTNWLLYLATCFAVALLTFRLTKQRRAAVISGILFAVMPAHTAPVSEMASRGHVLAGLFVVLCVLYYVLPRSRRNTLAACLFCILAVGSKETALVIPALLAVYELVFHRAEIWRNPRAVVWRQLPFWLIVLGLIALRFYLFGRLSSSSYGLGSWEWTYQVQGYMLYALAPFLADIFEWQAIIVFVVIALLMVVYRSRGAVIFGFLWVPITLLVTYASPPQERYLFTASAGIALALGSILAQPLSARVRWAQWAGGIVTAALVVGLTYGAWQRTTSFRNAGEIVASVFEQVKTLHPTVPEGSRFVFVGLPEVIRGGYLFNSDLQMQYGVQMLYGDDRTLRATRAENFPVTLTALDRTYFFEYDRRKIIERADLVQAMRDRRRCADAPENLVRWTFREGAEGWEAWNEIDSFEARKGSLYVRTNGADPFMGSPFLEIEPQELDRVEIRMLARADAPTFNAALYWLTTDMQDFSEEARTSFQVTADGESHTYELHLSVRGDAPLLRLRLDPADMPAEIQLERVTLYCR